jgi:phosphoglycerol transferase
MPKKNLRPNAGFSRNLFFLGGAVLFITLLFRNSGLYPVVFGDEYLYSKFSRLIPFADSEFPNYLYLVIYRTTNLCGDGFLNCARILNTLFFVASTPFIYLTSRLVCTRDVASLVAILALLGPINSYTAYYMPDSLYYFSFWLLTWSVLQLDNSSNIKSWFFGGILLGLSALIKPRALFILPAVVSYVLFVSRKKEGQWVLEALRNASVFVVFTFLTKFLISYFIAGKAGLTIFPPAYTSIATSSTTSNFQRYLELLVLSGKSFKGHVLAICLMFGMPIAFAIKASLDSVLSKEEASQDQKISFYALLILINLILVVSFYSASTVNYGPYESITRLHMRYYNFALPLLPMIAASQLSFETTPNALKWRAITAFPIGAAILYAIYTNLIPYTPNFVDSPELRGFSFNQAVFYILSGISFFALALWVYAARIGARVFVYLFIPLTVVFSTFYVNQELRQHLVPDVFAKAGIFTKQYLSNEDLSKLVIAGSDQIGLFRSLFYLDNPQTSLQMIPKGSSYDQSKLPVGTEWVLVIGDHSLPEETFFQLPIDGFTLARITGSNLVDFKKSSWPGIIAKSRGLSHTEAWGTWSSGDVVTLEFLMPLPEKFAIHLVAHAFGYNVGKEFVAHVGESSKSFVLGASPEEKVLKFINPQRVKTIKIYVPSPISPKELRINEDDRSLGIAFTMLRISPL